MEEMETFEPEVNNKGDKIHFQKVNIFGDEGVGKTNFISYLENYEKFEIQEDDLNNQQRYSFNKKETIVEKIKKVNIKCENIVLNLNIYESNLNRYNFIQMNLDTLLMQTELIIVMWELNEPESFNNAYNLINAIESGINNNTFRNVPIFLIQNKSDLGLSGSYLNINEGDLLKKIDKLKSEYPNIFARKISLRKKDENDYYDLILELYRKINEKDDKNNKEVFDMVKFKYPFKGPKSFDKNIINIKISLLGCSSTGKTSFIYALEEKKINNIQSTTDVSDRLQIISNIYKENINFTIIDTVGQERFRSIAPHAYKSADGFLIFFDVTNKDSFYDIDLYLNEIKNHNKTKQIILLGNKIDDNEKRLITKQNGKDKAEENGIKYFEISCLYGINILETLNEITLMSYKSYKLRMNENDNNNKNDNIGNKKENKNDNQKKTVNLGEQKESESSCNC